MRLKREVIGSRISRVLRLASRMVPPPRTRSHRKGEAKTFRDQPRHLHDRDARKFKITGGRNSQSQTCASSRCQDRRAGKKDSKARTPRASQNREAKGKNRSKAGVAMSNTG